MSKPPRLLDMPEVADLTRAPLETLRYWRHKGTGPKSFKVGRRVMYREDDVLTWLDEKYQQDQS